MQVFPILGITGAPMPGNMVSASDGRIGAGVTGGEVVTAVNASKPPSNAMDVAQFTVNSQYKITSAIDVAAIALQQ